LHLVVFFYCKNCTVMHGSTNIKSTKYCCVRLKQIYCCLSRNLFAEFRTCCYPQERRTAFSCSTFQNRSFSSRNSSIVCLCSFSFYPYLFTRRPSSLGRSVVTPHIQFASLYSHRRVPPAFLMKEISLECSPVC
jgi:hypothetical protein